MKEGERLRRWEGEIKSGQSLEFGMRNAECGKKKRDQSFECGMRNAECGKKKRTDASLSAILKIG